MFPVNRFGPWIYLLRRWIGAPAVQPQPWDKRKRLRHYMERTTSIGTSRCSGVSASPNFSRSMSKNSSRVRCPLATWKS